MKTRCLLFSSLALALLFASTHGASAQAADGAPPPEAPGGGRGMGGPGPFGPGGFGFGGPLQQEIKVVKQFDRDGDKRLNADERQAARQYLREQRSGRGPGGFGGRRGGFGRAGENEEPPQAGRRLTPSDVQSFPGAPVYDLATLRTFFLEFESAEWEKELEDFNHTDVEVPATLTVDGQVYREIGVHFRGASSYMMVPAGRKRSLNLSLDWVHAKQELGGYRTFNLLNSHEDPTFVRTVLYFHIARAYGPAPKANYVRVVINGESWGIYLNVQQFNGDFVRDWFGTTPGARWKVPGSPGGRGGLEYLGEDLAAYRRLYEIKSKDTPDSWSALVTLCKVLNQTAPDQLEQALAPLLDLDGVLKCLALENVLINNDGYWIRASDYHLYLDQQKRFHYIPYDANETFSGAGGPGFGGPGMGRGRRGGAGLGGGPPGSGVELDPLAGTQDASKPLLSKLLAVPALRARYLHYVRDLAEQWLDWKVLGPVARRCQAVIADEVPLDTRKLYSTEAFVQGLAEEPPSAGGFGGRSKMNLKSFAEQRRAFLLGHPEVSQTKM
jgi:hypothetical protein